MTYLTVQGDTWDTISFRLYRNEFYIDQLVVANSRYVTTVVFDAGVKLQVPVAVVPINSSVVAWGKTLRLS